VDGESEVLLFVYGTLRRGQPAQGMLEGARFVAEARTAPRYELLDLGAFPAMADGGKTAVAGEVYAVPPDLLPVLDRYEDCPHLYRRVAIDLADGSKALAYLVRRERLAPRFAPIPGGDWLARG